MTRAPLKRQRANSLVHALRLCKEWAQAKRHLSVERIADRMGTTHDSLYKWLATGRMPAILIPAYELACGCHYVSEWLAASSGALVVPMPTGRKAEGTELLDMNSSCAAALQLLTAFYAAPQAADTEATLAACACTWSRWPTTTTTWRSTPRQNWSFEHEQPTRSAHPGLRRCLVCGQCAALPPQRGVEARRPRRVLQGPRPGF